MVDRLNGDPLHAPQGVEEAQECQVQNPGNNVKRFGNKALYKSRIIIIIIIII